MKPDAGYGDGRPAHGRSGSLSGSTPRLHRQHTRRRQDRRQFVDHPFPKDPLMIILLREIPEIRMTADARDIRTGFARQLKAELLRQMQRIFDIGEKIGLFLPDPVQLHTRVETAQHR